ncbi:glycosyltransferase family 4 protein [Niastella caeni]|uniref:Glycosyltransferase family 4 protein n=1 Tax=Niastella caeni TaxID=2569763 RepID=A0A4S8HUP3_9BACT|nr:glycosyltransferase family 4 protein [Niastella caeni]THU39358.1 glycosyltransferase family 4 protein [Niastella caeni]
MKTNNQKINLLFFIGSFKGGGKERRLIELLSYLAAKDCYELMVVVTDPIIDFPAFYDLKITYHIIPKKWNRNDLTVFYKFYQICRQFKPDIIHTWGRVQSFYALPAVIGLRIPLVNGQITSAPPSAARLSLKRMIDRINFSFSTVILSNSRAGVTAYKPPQKKIKVIYNGISLHRFDNLPAPEQVRSKYGITTPFSVVMVASFSSNKNYELFFRIAEKVTSVRDDITFIAVGDSCNGKPAAVKLYGKLADRNPRIKLTGRISDVEAVINSCTLGVLFSNSAVHGEGISNAIIEYMSLGRPVMANDAGGTKEIVYNNVNGYLVTRQTDDEIAGLITSLIDDPEKCKAFGKAGRKIIEACFLIDKMGKDFEETYQDILEGRLKNKLSTFQPDSSLSSQTF